MCGIDKVTFYDTWKSIQGQKFWLSGEYLTNYACKQEKQPPFLSAGVVLDFFQQLAIWLILYSSEYQQSGFLKKINRLQILKWREIPAWLHLPLDVRARKDNSNFFWRLDSNGTKNWIKDFETKASFIGGVTETQLRFQLFFD